MRIRTSLVTFATTALLLASAGVATAADAISSLIPANSEIYFTLDTRKLIDSDVFKKLYNERLDSSKRAQIDLLNSLVGIDVLKDVNRVHIWGKIDQDDTVTAAIDGRFNKDKLVTLLKANETYDSFAEGDLTIHHWVDNKDAKERYGTFVSSDRVLVGNSKSALMNALAARKDKSANVTSTPNASSFSPAGDAVFYAFAITPEGKAGKNPNLKDLRSAVLKCDLTKAGFTADSMINMATAQSAKDVSDLAQAALVLARLQGDDPKLTELVSALSINHAEGSGDITMKFALPQEKLFKLIDEANVDVDVDVDASVEAGAEAETK
jgi:hypothetical protein